MKLFISHLSKQYRRDFDLELTPGVISLPGPSGTGKSMFRRNLVS